MVKFYYEKRKVSSLQTILKNIKNKSHISIHDIKCLDSKNITELAKKLAIEDYIGQKREEIILNILKNITDTNTVIAMGTVIVHGDKFAFIRYASSNYLPESDSIYISEEIVEQYKLRTGSTICGVIEKPLKGCLYFSLKEVLEINFSKKLDAHSVHFDDLTPIYPKERIILERKKEKRENNRSGRVIDIISPLGVGQRALIVAPPRTGKTMLLKNIAISIVQNHPDFYLIVLLIDERPEEVTDFKRVVNCEVVSSTFDKSAEAHIYLAEIVIEKAKRIVETGINAIVLLDSITRLGRSYNTSTPSSGKVLTGGVDSHALQRPKRFFGAARNTEESAGLTIIATALVDTGSKMDEVIFEEFKGTGNSELVLDRKLSERRFFPAIDINKSGTRREELIIDKDKLQKTFLLRRYISTMNTCESADFVFSKIDNTDDNEEFFDIMNA